MTGPTLLVLHHLAAPRSWTREDVRRVHVEERGWRDVGYQELIRQDGGPVEVIQGRPYDLDGEWEPWEYGAHVRGYNGKAWGCALVGDFDRDPVPESMLRAAVDLFASACRRWGLDESAVYGHGELAQTACPGRHVDLDSFRSRIAARLGRLN